MPLCRAAAVMPGLIRHPLAVDSGSIPRSSRGTRATGVTGPLASCRPVAVMPGLIRHPLAVDSGSGFRDQVAE
jgi:hypothetical protein